MYGLIWGYKQSYCKTVHISTPYSKDDFFLICQQSLSKNYEQLLTSIALIYETFQKVSDVLEDFFIQILEHLKYPEHSPVTVFKDMHTYLLQSYLYTSSEPYLISLLAHAETDLMKRPGITEAEKARIQELVNRIKPLKEYEQGPGVYIKHFQKTFKRTFHFNKHYKIEKKEHLDIR